jgi:hypothetical protein
MSRSFLLCCSISYSPDLQFLSHTYSHPLKQIDPIHPLPLTPLLFPNPQLPQLPLHPDRHRCPKRLMITQTWHRIPLTRIRANPYNSFLNILALTLDFSERSVVEAAADGNGEGARRIVPGAQV